jgi:plastocyanin
MTSARSLRIAALLASLALALGACASSATPNWTYAPPPSPSPSPSSSAASSASPSAGASPAASAASPIPSGSAAGSPAAALSLVASGIKFDKDSLEAPANKPFQIDFENQDQATQHNVQIADASKTVVWKGDLTTGPMKVTYNVTPLPAATYTFYCVVHPDMKGTLTVK